MLSLTFDPRSQTASIFPTFIKTHINLRPILTSLTLQNVLSESIKVTSLQPLCYISLLDAIHMILSNTLYVSKHNTECVTALQTKDAQVTKT